MERGGCVYIVTNKNHTVLYTGVTSDIVSRIAEHREKKYKNSFSNRYNCDKLVYYKFHPTIEEAIGMEKLIKAGSRQKKLRLIASKNANWRDLYDEISAF